MPPDALALANAIRTGKTTALAAMEASIAAARAFEPLGAVRHVDAAMGRAAAEAFDDRLKSGDADAADAPFAGLPFLMKDLGANAKDLPKVAGNAWLRKNGLLPFRDDDLTIRMRAAGLLPFGLTTVPEFGVALSSEPEIGPIARNPHDESLTPGGSSGGAAAAVAAGIVAIAHATDAGGSTRVPAACCGLVGLKASRGAMPTGPEFGNHLMGIASELVVSRSVRDTAAALDALAGNNRGPLPDPALGLPVLAALDTAPELLRIGILADAPNVEVTTERREAVEETGRWLKSEGHTLVPLDAGDFRKAVDDAQAVFATIILANFARNMGPVAGALKMGDTSILCRKLIDDGLALPASALFEADLMMARLSAAMWRHFETVDVILTPMLSGPPLPIGSFPLDHMDVDLHWRRMAEFSPYAALANVAGTPAVTVPVGADANGLPLPVQIIGPIASDGLLLRLARRLETKSTWQHRFPIAGFVE
ncbi:amidase [Hartmannibacter diazotrophicus]|uniref:amidase n=1 Tax=Hartmannibacter diazotrophicus TaxID=1482074 RepID=UPI000C14D97A|nr:amidase [Hartmannibacter diazotrophicus]